MYIGYTLTLRLLLTIVIERITNIQPSHLNLFYPKNLKILINNCSYTKGRVPVTKFIYD